MNNHSQYIVDEFADIFEIADQNHAEFDMKSYLHYRDDFYQIIRSDLRNEIETPEEIQMRFERCPEISDDTLLSFAAGNAEYYARILGIDVPSWCEYIPRLPENRSPIFPFPIILDDISDIIANTPIELKERGFIYDEHNFEIY